MTWGLEEHPNKKTATYEGCGTLIYQRLFRRVRDLNSCAGVSRFDGFRVRCITTLPTLHVVNGF